MSLLGETLAIFPTLLLVVDPVAAIPVALHLTRDASPAERRAVASRAAWASGVILLSFAMAGEGLMRAFGITLAGLRAAGGVLLLRTALDMLDQRPAVQAWSPAERSTTILQLSLFPLATPLLAGPAALVASASMWRRASGLHEALPVALSIVLTSVVTWLLLCGAGWVQRKVPGAVLGVVSRLTGLLLAALAMDLGLDGLRELLIR